VSKLKPGQVRDGIEHFLTLKSNRDGADVQKIAAYLDGALGEPVPRSSVRSYLGLNTPGKFERIGRGKYRLAASRGV
jgi:site-specific DNA-methyltransferase (adenine-specific)